MGTPTYTPLATKTLTATATSVTFSSIGQGFRDLVLVTVNSPSSGNYVQYNINGDLGANYPAVVMSGNGSTTYSATNNFPYADMTMGILAPGITIISNFMDYSATDKHKTFISRGNLASSGAGASAHRWANTSAITSISINQGGYGSFAIGSTFTLYGINS